MKLTVLVPSEEYKSYAGARIRYGRVGPELSGEGIDLVLEDIGRFDPSTAVCDALLISKCHDAQSLIAAAAMSDRGALVGVDLFDDYFSDPADSRLLRYQSWLKQLIGMCDFALCSTTVMADVVLRFDRSLPVHILNDPGPVIDDRFLSAVIARKLRDARDNRLLRIGWFGVGDNPYFPVGLADLSAYSAPLGELTRSGMDVQLTVLTNRRALRADGLTLVRQLPIQARVQEWSEAAERDLLENALLVFLPVNSQPFSRAKSLNRAVTALSSGCQVLSAGYPLYSALDSFIYRDAKLVLDDLAHGTLRLSQSAIGQFRAVLDAVADGTIEGRKLAAFLGQLQPGVKRAPLSLTLIHGHSTRGEAHSMVKAAKGFSVASPYCSALLDFDVIFRGRSSDLRMLVSKETAVRLLPHARSLRNGGERIRGHHFVWVADERQQRRRRPTNSHSVALELATYGSTMREIERRMIDAFGASRIILSETSWLPLQAPFLAA